MDMSPSEQRRAISNLVWDVPAVGRFAQAFLDGTAEISRVDWKSVDSAVVYAVAGRDRPGPMSVTLHSWADVYCARGEWSLALLIHLRALHCGLADIVPDFGAGDLYFTIPETNVAIWRGLARRLRLSDADLVERLREQVGSRWEPLLSADAAADILALRLALPALSDQA